MAVPTEEESMIHRKLMTFPRDEVALTSQSASSFSRVNNYTQAEQQFIQLLETEDLDRKLAAEAIDTGEVETAIATAIEAAYTSDSREEAAHRFLQRILYRINRLKLFWYDDLRHYINERSFYLNAVRETIETTWQQWEASQLEVSAYAPMDVEQALKDRTAIDIDPPPSADSLFIQDQVNQAGYRHLVAIASLDGLVEAS